MENRKIFIGSGKKKEFSNGGSIINASICIDDLLQQVNEFATQSTGNGKKYIKLKIGSRKQADNFGNTHFIEIDTWKPEPQQGGEYSNPNPTYQSQPAQPQQIPACDDPNDPNYIPF